MIAQRLMKCVSWTIRPSRTWADNCCDFYVVNGIIRYSFTQCPNAEFARRHHMEAVLPVLCNCDHLAMQAIHAALIREGTCMTSDCCDYCIVGDKNPIAAEYELKQADNCLWISAKKRHPKETQI